MFSEEKLENPEGPYILVENTLDAMKKIAADYRRGLDIKVVRNHRKRWKNEYQRDDRICSGTEI